MLTLHAVLGQATLLYAVVLTLWIFGLTFRDRAVGGSWLASHRILIAAIAVQGLLGVGAMLLGSRPRSGLHVMYGIAALVISAGSAVSSSRLSPRNQRLVLAGSTLLVSFLLVRGLMTA